MEINPLMLTAAKISLQGLTLRFQSKGPKRSFDENQWSETGYLVIMHTIMGPMSEKSRGPKQNLGAYAPGPLRKSNPGLLSLGKFLNQKYSKECF